jgi:hypothetical protein
MDVRGVPIKDQLISKALHALLIGVFLFATQPRILDFIPEYWPHHHEKIVPLDDLVDASSINRGGKGDDAQNQFQWFLDNLSAIFVVQEFITFTAKRHIIRFGIPLRGSFQIRSPPV